MKSSTYRWVIGCLSGVIAILIAFLVLKETGTILVSFPDCLSLTATVSSLILSVVAMFYTFYSGRDTQKISEQIKTSISEIDNKVLRISEEAGANSEVLGEVKQGMAEAVSAIQTISKAIEKFQPDQVTQQEKDEILKDMESTKNSMLMFLDKMK